MKIKSGVYSRNGKLVQYSEIDLSLLSFSSAAFSQHWYAWAELRDRVHHDTVPAAQRSAATRPRPRPRPHCWMSGRCRCQRKQRFIEMLQFNYLDGLLQNEGRRLPGSHRTIFGQHIIVTVCLVLTFIFLMFSLLGFSGKCNSSGF